MDDLGPFHNRSWEWRLYQPLVGKTMLELGDKVNRRLTYKAFFESLGYRHVSVDLNGLHGALKMDLRRPLNLGTFDFISNIGTTEHVASQHGVWRNICEAMHVGSVLASITPAPGHWVWHGMFYPKEEFYRQLAALNGLSIERLYTEGCEGRKMVFARMSRVAEVPFSMPDESNLYRNKQ